VDLPGLKRDEVKVEVEDGRILRISRERSREKEDKNDMGQWQVPAEVPPPCECQDG